VIYKRALLIELKKIPLKCAAEIEKAIFYESELIGKRRLDVLVQENVLVELKALAEFDNGCYAKIINYLRVFDIDVGLLLNFGARSLQFKRFINVSAKSI
jgi:GxxExxY protein